MSADRHPRWWERWQRWERSQPQGGKNDLGVVGAEKVQPFPPFQPCLGLVGSRRTSTTPIPGIVTNWSHFGSRRSPDTRARAVGAATPTPGPKARPGASWRQQSTIARMAEKPGCIVTPGERYGAVVTRPTRPGAVKDVPGPRPTRARSSGVCSVCGEAIGVGDVVAIEPTGRTYHLACWHRRQGGQR